MILVFISRNAFLLLRAKHTLLWFQANFERRRFLSRSRQVGVDSLFRCRPINFWRPERTPSSLPMLITSPACNSRGCQWLRRVEVLRGKPTIGRKQVPQRRQDAVMTVRAPPASRRRVGVPQTATHRPTSQSVEIAERGEHQPSRSAIDRDMICWTVSFPGGPVVR
jgi:hypothetical protein